jgi:ribosomal protein S18 acetylase RimI-like enzyme
MTITSATISDIPALVGLVNRGYRGDSARQGWTSEADLLDGTRIDEPTLNDYITAANSEILLYKNDEAVLMACVYLQNAGGYLYLGMLTVDPTEQGKGTGKILLKEAERRALKAGIATIRMTVISLRSELIAWYKRHGYADTGLREPFPAGVQFGQPKFELEFMVLEKQLLPDEC